MQTEPVEGIMVELADDSDLFEWKVWMEGPKDTAYEGGVFLLSMTFPHDYPMSPPELKFVSDFWHPNGNITTVLQANPSKVYNETGGVCISILHPPGEDEMSGELPGERWMPTQTVQTILLSVISLLSAPNFSSPANVDANVEWRSNPEGFKQHIAKLVQKANKEKPSHVVIPHPDTNPEERKKQVAKIKAMNDVVEDALDEEMMYDSHEPSEDEQEKDSSLEENQSQSEDKSDTTKEKSSSKSKKGSVSKSEHKTKDTKQEALKDKTKNEHKKKEEPDLTIEPTGPSRKKKKKCTIM